MYENKMSNLTEEEIARKWAQKMTDDELIDTYCDWGAMGRNADCSPEEWDAVQEEMDRRGI